MTHFFLGISPTVANNNQRKKSEQRKIIFLYHSVLIEILYDPDFFPCLKYMAIYLYIQRQSKGREIESHSWISRVFNFMKKKIMTSIFSKCCFSCCCYAGGGMSRKTQQKNINIIKKSMIRKLSSV